MHGKEIGWDQLHYNSHILVVGLSMVGCSEVMLQLELLWNLGIKAATYSTMPRLPLDRKVHFLHKQGLLIINIFLHSLATLKKQKTFLNKQIILANWSKH